MIRRRQGTRATGRCSTIFGARRAVLRIRIADSVAAPLECAIHAAGIGVNIRVPDSIVTPLIHSVGIRMIRVLVAAHRAMG
jgi:hypothetical protein